MAVINYGELENTGTFPSEWSLVVDWKEREHIGFGGVGQSFGDRVFKEFRFLKSSLGEDVIQ